MMYLFINRSKLIITLNQTWNDTTEYKKRTHTKRNSRQLIALCNWKSLAQPLPLEELIEAFDKNKLLFHPDRITLEESERLRSSFVSDFPIDKIQAMKLDEYIPGKLDPRSGQVDKRIITFRKNNKTDA